MEIETAKQKAVSGQSLTESLTTFGDLYREALPEERKELIRLRVNQLIWTPDEIRLALLDQVVFHQDPPDSQRRSSHTAGDLVESEEWQKTGQDTGHQSNALGDHPYPQSLS